MQPLLDQLNSRKPAVREAALRDARALSPDALLQLIVLESRTRQNRTKKFRMFYFSTAAMVLFGVDVVPAPAHKWATRAAMLTMFITQECRNWYKDKYRVARREFYKLLMDADDPRLVVKILQLNSEVQVNALQDAAKRLLPLVRANHAAQWSKEDKAALLLPFTNYTKDPQLTMCCLKALEQVGDQSAIPAVKKLIERAFADNRATIWNAAKECLLYLENNTGRFRQAETLLRASDANASRADILLRPALPITDNDTGEQLLRPGVPEQ